MPATMGGEAVLVASLSGGGHLSRVYYGKCLLWITLAEKVAPQAFNRHGISRLDAVRRADVFPLHAPAYPVIERGRLHLYDRAPALNDRGHVARTEHHRAQQVAEILPAPFPCAV